MIGIVKLLYSELEVNQIKHWFTEAPKGEISWLVMGFFGKSVFGFDA